MSTETQVLLDESGPKEQLIILKIYKNLVRRDSPSETAIKLLTSHLSEQIMEKIET